MHTFLKWISIGFLAVALTACGSDGADGDQGDTGPEGAKGDQGAAGATGAKGDKGENGFQGAKGDPGEKGDQGDQGDAGVDGATWSQGSGAPDDTDGGEGIEGDFYLDTDTGDVYQKGEDGWEVVDNIKGAQGDKGDQGDKGADGATWSQGTGSPDDADGNVGDFYLDSASGNIYQKKEAGWEVVANIKGGGSLPGCDGNAAPVINELTSMEFMCQGASKVFTVDATDADDDPLTYQFLGAAGVDIEPAIDWGGTKEPIPEARTLKATTLGGPFYVTVTVSDSCATITDQIKFSTIKCNVWGSDKSAGAPETENVYAVASDKDDGAIVAGATFDKHGGTDCLAGFTCGDTLDVFVSFYGYFDGYSRTIVFGSDKNDSPTDVVFDYATGDLFVIGKTMGNLDGQANADATGVTNDIFVVKFNSAGTKQWTKLFGTTTEDNPGEASLGGGFLYIAAETLGDFGTDTNAGLNDPLLLKVSATDGSLAWYKQWGSDKSEGIRATDIDSAGDIYAVGNNFSDELGTIAKFNPDGTLLYAKEEWTDKFRSDIIIHRDDTNGDRIYVAAQGANSDSPTPHEVFEVNGPDGAILDRITLIVDDGSRPTQINAIALGPNGEPHICGATLTEGEESNVFLGILDVSGADMAIDSTLTWGTPNVDGCNDIHGLHSVGYTEYYVRLAGKWNNNDYFMTSKSWAGIPF